MSFITCNTCNGTGIVLGDICCEFGGNYYCDVCDERMDGSESQLEHCSHDDEHICDECMEVNTQDQTRGTK